MVAPVVRLEAEPAIFQSTLSQSEADCGMEGRGVVLWSATFPVAKPAQAQAEASTAICLCGCPVLFFKIQQPCV